MKHQVTTQTKKWNDKKINGVVPVSAAVEKNLENKTTREMDYSDFTNVEVDCAFKFKITRSEQYKVSITADKKLIDYVKVIKSGNTLRISVTPIRFKITPSPKIKPILAVKPTLEAEISMPLLKKLHLSSAVKGTVKGFKSRESFALTLSGASTLNIDIEAGDSKIEISGASKVKGNMQLGNTEITLSGSSAAELKGSAGNMVLHAWGASKPDLAAFAVKDTSLQLNGASQASIRTNGKLDLDMSGTSRLNYAGNVSLNDINLTGASTLTQS